MLTGKELGVAIREAVDLKKVRLADVARHFHVSPPSVQDWINKGTIHKRRLPELWLYFSDVVGPEHWGLSSFPDARVPGQVFDELTDDERQLLENFRILTDPEQQQFASEIARRAELLRSYLERQMTRLTPRRHTSDVMVAPPAKDGSTDEQTANPSLPPPAERYGLDSLGGESGNHAGTSEDQRGTPREGRRRA
jgi:hypothetical protein